MGCAWGVRLVGDLNPHNTCILASWFSYVQWFNHSNVSGRRPRAVSGFKARGIWLPIGWFCVPRRKKRSGDQSRRSIWTERGRQCVHYFARTAATYLVVDHRATSSVVLSNLVGLEDEEEQTPITKQTTDTHPSRNMRNHRAIWRSCFKERRILQEGRRALAASPCCLLLHLPLLFLLFLFADLTAASRPPFSFNSANRNTATSGPVQSWLYSM